VTSVLGVGIGKPTFKILDAPIKITQGMEHHGAPMAVHVSRAVYKLVYGDMFVFKEREIVEV
jgi:hypothetical protein